MGEALAAGLVEAGWAPADELVVVEVAEARRDALAQRLDGVEVVGSAPGADGTVIAVKPADVEAALGAAAESGTDRVLSIAAGVRLDALESAAGSGTPVVRAMTNTPTLVRAGAAAIAAGSHAGEDDLAWAEDVLGSVGTVARVPEDLLDAVTGLSGSGPAYVFLIAEALVDAGVLVGLPRELSEALVTQTLLGSAALLAESGDDAVAHRAALTSPGGTTAAGLRVLEAEGVRGAVLDAVDAATRRSRELGGG